MKFLFSCFIVAWVTLVSCYNEYETNIIFRTFNTENVEFNSTFDNNDTLLANCDPTSNYTVVVHGWTESIDAVWALSVIQNFLDVRNGCVFFMDYDFYSQLSYAGLVAKFPGIWAVLKRKLQQLEENGFDPANAHMFGFSFGSQLVFESAYQYGAGKIARADCCDPAGPSFPATAPSVKHAKTCAKQVQCIHTSSDKGTSLRYCQKDIDMGECGLSQIGATIKPYLSHGLCPIFYNNSFTNDFALVPKTLVKTTYGTTCTNKTVAPDVTLLGPQTMGYWMDMSLQDGEYYSLTGKLAPFNLI